MFTFTILDICRSVQQVFLFCFLVCSFLFVPPSASRHPCRFERTRSHTLAPPPPRLGPNLKAQFVDGGSRSRGRYLRDRTDAGFYFIVLLKRAHSEFPF